jgi:predicted acyl esterase
MNKRLLALAAVTVLTGLLVPMETAFAAPVPSNATWQQVWFPSEDGTMLRADVLLPKNRQPTDRHPVILSIGPYFGRNALNAGALETGPVMRFADIINGGDIFNRGYAWVQVDSRGYGGSDGCNDFGGRGEQMDTEAAVNWAAQQSWSNGRVGMWGKSYDAWTQVMALAENPVGLKAVVIQSPLIEAYRGMWMNGVHFDSGWYATPSLYTGYDVAPTTAGDPRPEEHVFPAKGTATNGHCIAEKTAMTATHEYSLPYWQERNIVDLAARSDVPTIWSHGFNDVNTKPSNFLDVFERLEGPKRLWFGQWAHDRANEVNLVGRDGFITEAMDFFDHYLKGLPLVEHPNAEIQDNEGSWRSETEWPPADATPYSLPVKAGSYVDDGANTATRGTWSVSQPAPYDLRIAGTPKLTVNVTTQAPLANLVAQVYDVDDGGSGTLLSRGAYRLGSSGQVKFDLFPNDWIVREGHRIALRLSSFDSLFHTVGTRTTVGVTGGSLAIPYLRYIREANLEGQASTRTSPTQGITQAQIDGGAVTAEFPPEMIPRP